MRYLETSSLKINLTLRVLNRRANGYHDIHSLFWRLPSPEVLSISEAKSPGHSDLLEVRGAEIAGENILTKTLNSLRANVVDSPIPLLDMTLHKHIPAGSGVGAGSGNAAALLRWVRRRYDRSPAPDALASLGADVAFLASDFNLAFADGVGEILTGVPERLNLSALICFPNWASNTATAYRTLDEMRASAGDEAVCDAAGARDESARILERLQAGELVGLLPNDFIPCFSQYKLCYNSFYEMVARAGAMAWGLCGSGSACFALYSPGSSKEIAAAFAALSRFEWLDHTLIVE